MRDMSSGLYVVSECIINYQHLDMRVTAAKIVAATISRVRNPAPRAHRWRVNVRD